MKKPTTDIWADPAAFRQQVRMPAVQVAALAPAELAQALAFELEPFSGIPAAQAEVAYRPVADADASVRVYDAAVRSRAAQPGARSPRALGIAGLFAALVVLGLAADAWTTFRTERRLAREMAVRRGLQAQVKQLDARTAACRAETERLAAARAAAEAAQRTVAALRAAHPALLEALAASCGRRASLLQLASAEPFTCTFTALAATNEDAARALVALGESARRAGWHLEPGTLERGAPAQTVRFGGTLRHD